MKIIVKESNKDRINKEINNVQAGCSVRLIDYRDLETAIEDIENKLKIPKRAMKGIVAWVDPWAQHFPNAYQYPPKSTKVKLTRFSSGWALTHVCRSTCGNTPNKRYALQLPEEAKEAIINNYKKFSF